MGMDINSKDYTSKFRTIAQSIGKNVINSLMITGKNFNGMESAPVPRNEINYTVRNGKELRSKIPGTLRVLGALTTGPQGRVPILGALAPGPSVLGDTVTRHVKDLVPHRMLSQGQETLSTKHRMCLGICKGYKVKNIPCFAGSGAPGPSVLGAKAPCSCYDKEPKKYDSVYLKFYEEFLFKNFKTFDFSLLEMYVYYVNWYKDLYESIPNLDEKDLAIKLNTYTPMIDYYYSNKMNGKWIKI
jgi:hypothetical protein